MRPIKLCISAWGPYKDRAEIDFTQFFGQGLFLITGATGAGKTTIFDAITYALYGALSGEIRDKERNSVRSDFAEAQTPTFVELTMEHGGKEYFIRRNPEYFRPKKRSSGEGMLTREKENALLNLPDGKVIEGVREVNSKLQELLGVDLQQFKQLSIIAQGEFARLLTASPKDKTKIFREIFGTGIYERFTYNLSKEAKKRYQKVAEQKAKLDEDLRILAGGFKDMPVAEDVKAEFLGFLELSAVPFDRVTQCLETMEQQLSEALTQNKKRNDKNEKEILKTQSLLTSIEEENKRIKQFLQATATLEQLEEQKALYAEKEGIYSGALNASYLEADAVKIVAIKGQVEKMCLALGLLEQSMAKNQGLLAEELPVFERREELSQWISERQEYLQKKKELEAKQAELSGKKVRLEKDRLQYVALDGEARSRKERYEDALRRRSYAAIGIAAQLLEEGKPCPVCGALEHPSPAVSQEKVVSEEELELLKAEADSIGEQTQQIYGQVLRLQAEVSMLEKAEALLRESVAKLQALVEAAREIPKELATLSGEKAAKRLQEICDQVNSLKATIMQQEKQCRESREELQNLGDELEELETDFAEKLKIHGFSDKEAYEAAYMSKMDRDALSEEISGYKERLTAAGQLCSTLKEHITGIELKDSGEAELHLKSLLELRKELSGENRNLEYSRSEVKRCKKQLAEKEKTIRRESEEYGFIKELENIATGNNPKRLVFEQYVLAGYFDEILVAANIRFRKMSGGRYEMRRVKEVSDGRVKDNLEIEVMDYYTGKPRSVRTLSGGESFKASLSLALGLSDVIQSMNGGIKVDTLFIDEGFGALDGESLDQACNTLNTLVENSRLIGIISHVPELRERISKQLIIEKTGGGSSVKAIIS
ncbi:MAG: SMC family ATPase [Lachnospiraceae bacterium]|nr:SMC family ATPase [Lachnospiraceae bacterium]